MKLGFWVRLNFLVLGLLACLYAINSLNKRGLNEDLKQALVISENQGEVSRAARFEKLVSLNLCGRPVQFVQRLGESQGRRIDKRANSNLSAWLEANCALLISHQESASRSRYEPMLLIGYSGGQKTVLYGNNEGDYRWAGRAFRSSQLDAALANMDRLISGL